MATSTSTATTTTTNTIKQSLAPSRHRFTAPNTIPRYSIKPNPDQLPIRLTDSIKNQFNASFPLLAARVPSALITQFKSNSDIKRAVLNSKNLRSVEPDPDSKDHAFKLLLLNTPDKDKIPESTLKVLEAHSIELKKTTLDLKWDYWTADEIISRLLPTELTDTPASFTIIGHIAHLNLRDEYLPYKYVIGQVILEKNMAIETVVNKIDTINSQFRFFQMELLAGEPKYTVTLSQSGCRYRFDFSKVYYNPRLSTEHDLLSSTIKKDQVVVDAFAGVGPFAIRAAANQKAWVLASDLNPASVEALTVNTKLNKLNGRIIVSQGDGRERIRSSILTLWKSNPFFDSNLNNNNNNSKSTRTISNNNNNNKEKELKPPINTQKLLPDHFIINLPDSSISLLDCFIGLYDPLRNQDGFLDSLSLKSSLPLLHCYCFTKDVDNPEVDICQRVSEVLKVKIDSNSVKRFELKFVRAVAPHKDMYRLTFELPLEVLLPSSI